ncbi:hypothetical protein MMC20_001829 [Loxospora ochrophaea]|nr:hypothetical protein [Loxospora ochrophaea]
MSSPTPTQPQPQPQIHTYHCLCSHLLLATLYPLSSLPRRGPPALDKAYILPLPAPPSASSSATPNDDDDDDDDDDADDAMNREGSAATAPHRSAAEKNHDDAVPPAMRKRDAVAKYAYSLLLNTTLDRRPVVVRREDGFEKRWVRRCGRCRVAVGYGVEGEGRGGKGGEGKVVFLLEGGLVGTGELG